MERGFKSADNPVFDFWNKLMINMWTVFVKPAGSPFTWFTQSDMGKDWQIPLNVIQALNESFSGFTGDKKTGSDDAAFLSELVSGLVQTGFNRYLDLQKKWVDNARRGSFCFQDIGSLSHVPLIWLESIQKLLGSVPDTGARGPAQDLLASYAAFAAKISELLYQVYLPMDKASKAWAESMDKMHGEGVAPQNIEESMHVWFSVFESSCLDLFKSPEYARLLRETSDAYEQYRKVRSRVYGPSSTSGPKPQDRAVDSLSDEISKLREKLEELLQKVDLHTSRTT